MFTGSSGVHGNHYSFELGGNALVFRFPRMMLLAVAGDIPRPRHTLLLQAAASHRTPPRGVVLEEVSGNYSSQRCLCHR